MYVYECQEYAGTRQVPPTVRSVEVPGRYPHRQEYAGTRQVPPTVRSMQKVAYCVLSRDYKVTPMCPIETTLFNLVIL